MALEVIYKKCANCGKVFTGDYDWKAYVYKKGYKFYCCWECFRQRNKKKKQKRNFVCK